MPVPNSPEDLAEYLREARTRFIQGCGRNPEQLVLSFPKYSQLVQYLGRLTGVDSVPSGRLQWEGIEVSRETYISDDRFFMRHTSSDPMYWVYCVLGDPEFVVHRTRQIPAWANPSRPGFVSTRRWQLENDAMDALVYGSVIRPLRGWDSRERQSMNMITTSSEEGGEVITVHLKKRDGWRQSRPGVEGLRYSEILTVPESESVQASVNEVMPTQARMVTRNYRLKKTVTTEVLGRTPRKDYYYEET